MSYSRDKYYIFGDGENIHFDCASVPNEAIEVFITSLVRRGELEKWINCEKVEEKIQNEFISGQVEYIIENFTPPVIRTMIKRSKSEYNELLHRSLDVEIAYKNNPSLYTGKNIDDIINEYEIKLDKLEKHKTALEIALGRILERNL